jgi:steroid 5-alpha reductase family enzyme
MIGLLKKDFSIIDTAWGLAFVVVYFAGVVNFHHEIDQRNLLIGVFVCVWAIRLSSYIFYRSIKLGKEDYRYAAWREEWGPSANLNFYFRVFMLQAVLAAAVAYPLYLVHYYKSNISFGTILDILGSLLFIVGFLFEAIADFQKNAFKSDPANKGKVMQQGLWKYSRHPNYFGEALLWWGIFFIVINVVPWYYAIFGPLLIHFLLIKVSGVAMLEKKYDTNSEYKSYRERTNAFIPFFPKKGEQ